MRPVTHELQVAALELSATVVRPKPAGHVHERLAPVPVETKPVELHVHVASAPVELAPTGQAVQRSARPV